MAGKAGLRTIGYDCPDLNAAIRAVGKAVRERFDIRIIGFRDGLHGLVQSQTQEIYEGVLSGGMTGRGNILGTSLDKPHPMVIRDKTLNMIPQL